MGTGPSVHGRAGFGARPCSTLSRSCRNRFFAICDYGNRPSGWQVAVRQLQPGAAAFSSSGLLSARHPDSGCQHRVRIRPRPFVYMLGLSAGPSFFSSFRRRGLRATAIVTGSPATALGIAQSSAAPWAYRDRWRRETFVSPARRPLPPPWSSSPPTLRAGSSRACAPCPLSATA